MMALESLDDVRTFIDSLTLRLDPESRYITELLAIVNRSDDLANFRANLIAGCRGRYWAGVDTFATMTFEDQIRVNLITNESEFMRFDLGELSFLRDVVIPWLDQSEGRICSVPAANGEEAVSIAIECLEAGVSPFSVAGFEIQKACVHTANSGRIPLSGLPKYVVGVVDDCIREHLQFHVADVFVDPLRGPYELVVCRNFLGYFKPDSVREVLAKLTDSVVVGGFLMLDSFILTKHPEVVEGLPLTRIGNSPFFRRA